ncbi:hypothetical protein VW29_15620 [Devosia limi DSM 17137]|uniref:Uncharacterized protein n=1 Tax=Devosia limi DSM 17137 TaxID=1121477 RepID=A0A0F5LJZ2_9HYPH|nr:hypothetical protein [Devosia limi]KKB82726.1 hypothetical protein VW29_15620 [Devosia limi DSM 17137]SHE39727.1 hypothetical protein SAMN02745223_00273 [Devosia limi DSM 17137]
MKNDLRAARLARDWPTIRDAYENGTDTIATICATFGVTKGSLEHRMRRDLWLPRSAQYASSRSLLMARIYRVMDRQVQWLESLEPNQQTEKEARALSIIVKTLENLTDMQPTETVTPPKQKKDMRDLRDKLAKRIDQFKQR